jgi:hypothetical protein
MLSEFVARVRLYAHWDDRLRSRTRFFAAAAATNAALVELCSLRCSQHWIVNAGLELLAVIGRQLEGLNIVTARDLERGALPNMDLDTSLITLEQTALERVLHREIARSPHNYGQAIRQINRLLFWVEQCAWSRERWPSGYLYRNVLRRVRGELGRRPDFAVLRDRVIIGRALIHMLPDPLFMQEQHANP